MRDMIVTNHYVLWKTKRVMSGIKDYELRGKAVKASWDWREAIPDGFALREG